ncbi:MAG: glycine--tRNA ligase subunit beta [Deltaproteobacteria bacterium]|nr:glycine--tRNA ligase subunit beta [Deltaproteobacteria bacterium]MBW2129416.1 glycine--tRNA ligase subunit beta [Deltaproteobacteria bacterium]MBW2302945.1 glycine--tRNA ligase subunit beta [Deltaproteobacteria bacterium]
MDERGATMGELLFEIGTEEIPSDYQEEALREFKRLAESRFKEQRIGIGEGFETYGTPRRLVLIGRNVAAKQEDAVQEITGPPKRAAYDEEGNPTKAALGFAKKQGVPIEELECRETPKGEYLFVRRRIEGKPTLDVLPEILPSLVAEIPWPKSMRWGSLGFSFVRPVHWILALFEGKVIPFETAGVQSGNRTRGHRFMSPEAVEVSGLEDYFQKTRERYVLIDPGERSRIIREAVASAAGTVSGIPGEDPELLATVTNMVEWPTAICGGFDRSFLSLPEPVLITAMKKHQKYFSVRDPEGRLLPNFVAVNNTRVRDEKVVRKGLERVLRARLADADFFFKEDRKRPLISRLEDLKQVIYQADLGTSYAKIQRFTRLAEYLAQRFVPDKIDEIRTAAKLCKCDLETEMVMEFTSLQGVMGKEYARLEGYPEEICTAIHEHYLPDRAGGDLPTTAVGAAVGTADRMDTITGCFAVGLEPTGAADPFALRRHALAIIRILEKFGWELSLTDFITRSTALLKEEIDFDEGAVSAKVTDFFRERYRQMMLRSDFKTDLVEAVISADFDIISQLRARIEQLDRFVSQSGEFESLVLTVKRVTNILKKESEIHPVDPALFKEKCETALWDAYQSVKDDVLRNMEGKNYFEALNLMAGLRKPVDDLFEGVEILTGEEPRLRNNRVGLLQELSRFFSRMADFSKFGI